MNLLTRYALLGALSAACLAPATLVAEGYTVHCAIDTDYQPQPVPESFRKVIEAYEGR